MDFAFSEGFSGHSTDGWVPWNIPLSNPNHSSWQPMVILEVVYFWALTTTGLREYFSNSKTDGHVLINHSHAPLLGAL